MKKIIVIGSGTMGSGIAQVIAESGFDVVMQDINEKITTGGMEKIRKSMARSVEKGRMTEEDMDAALSRLKCVWDEEKAGAEYRDADLIIEAAVENIDVKKALYKTLEKFCPPDVIFASNTSSLSITELASATMRPQKFIGLHFFKPGQYYEAYRSDTRCADKRGNR
jgi:3-hydroxybutyryl-CoA dehydrogenase